MIIKVCGMRDAQNIRDVESLRPDMMGFMCWNGSKRYVSDRPYYLPDVCRVGVFVNPTADEVVQKVRELGLNRIQLHGAETPQLSRAIHKVTGLPIMKAIQVDSADDFVQCSAFERADGVDMFLFDTKCSGWGGSGQSFDWSLSCLTPNAAGGAAAAKVLTGACWTAMTVATRSSWPEASAPEPRSALWR